MVNVVVAIVCGIGGGGRTRGRGCGVHRLQCRTCVGEAVVIVVHVLVNVVL